MGKLILVSGSPAGATRVKAYTCFSLANGAKTSSVCELVSKYCYSTKRDKRKEGGTHEKERRDFGNILRDRLDLTKQREVMREEKRDRV